MNNVKAGLSYVVLDENFNYVSGGYHPVNNTTSGGLKNHFIQGIDIVKNGYIYIYCSDESNIDVFFDNLEIIHDRGPILEENHYYPYGLRIAAISSRAAGAMQNNYLYQSDFSEYDEETGYNEFYLRHYDGQIGRWTTADPYEQFASPYLGMGNSPGGMVDPDGGEGTNWYRPLGTTFIQWFDGTGEIDGYENLGASLYGWYNIGDGEIRWTHFMDGGAKMWALDGVIVDGVKKSGSKASVRFFGGLKAIGGTLEAVIGAGFGVATSWTGFGAIAGGFVAVHGMDGAAAGFNQLITGRETKSFTEQGISRGLQVAGMSEQKADYWAGNADAGISILGSGWAGGGLLRGTTLARGVAGAGEAAKGATGFADDAIRLTTSSKSLAPSRTYSIFDGSGQLYKFGVTDANLARYGQSLRQAGPGAYGKFSSIMPKNQAHIMEKYLRSLHYNSTGQYALPGMKIPYPVNFNTGLPIRP